MRSTLRTSLVLAVALVAALAVTSVQVVRADAADDTPPPESPPADGASDVNCSKMRVKALKVFLQERGHECKGCAEKADFVEMCEKVKDEPVLPPKEEEKPAEPADLPDDLGGEVNQAEIDRMMAQLKGDYSHVKDKEKRKILQRMHKKGLSMSGMTDMDIEQLRNLEKALSGGGMGGLEL